MIDLAATQVSLESDAVINGAARYMSAVTRDAGRGRAMDSPVAERLLRKHMRRLSVHLSKLQGMASDATSRSMTAGGRLAGWEWRMQTLNPEVMAYVVLKTVVSLPHVASARQQASVAMLIGQSINNEVWYSQARVEERERANEEGEYSRFDALARKIKQLNTKSVRHWMRVLSDLKAKRWENSECVRLGAVILENIMPHLSEVLEYRMTWKNKTSRRSVHVTARFIQHLDAGHGLVSMNTPWLVPMIVTPRPWVLTPGGELTGGYLTLAAEGLKSSGQYQHTSVDGLPDEALAGINAVQSTRWAINEQVLRVAEDAFAFDLGPTPYSAPQAMPALVDAAVWDTLDAQARGRLKHIRSTVYDHNAVQAEKKQAQMRALTIAKSFEEYDAIFFPMSFDWRTRFYPLPQDLHPQASDFVKSLLHFADAKPVGSGGVARLTCQLADHFGMDKNTAEEKRAWVRANHARICAFADNPWGDLMLWAECEDESPWLFLAVAIEYRQMMLLPASKRHSFMSRAVASIDGSCNGIQHLSAMALDPKGGAEVNLFDGPRRDIYKKVSDTLDAGARADTSPAAAVWVGNITRKLCKRPVMTKPYGVTARGIRDQIIASGVPRDLETDDVSRRELLDYIVPALDNAIKTSIPKAQEAMNWMVKCAAALAKQQEGISWMTPLGVRVIQSYTELKQTRVTTILGRVNLGTPDPQGKLKVAKQKSSIVPNIIHSFDAAHLLLTVLSCEIDKPGMSYAMVHDSFGTHVADLEQLSAACRVNFVAIYRDDWFESLAQDFTFFSKSKIEMPAAPERGDLDIERVASSTYFFV